MMVTQGAVGTAVTASADLMLGRETMNSFGAQISAKIVKEGTFGIIINNRTTETSDYWVWFLGCIQAIGVYKEEIDFINKININGEPQDYNIYGNRIK